MTKDGSEESLQFQESVIDSVSRAADGGTPMLVTGGSVWRRLELINDVLTMPVVVVDCQSVSEYSQIAQSACFGLEGTFEEYERSDTPDAAQGEPFETMQHWFDVEDVAEQHDFALVFSAFDALPKRDQVSVAQKLKGLYEATDIQLVVTADEEESLFLANGDLTSRVKTASIEPSDE